MNGWQRFGLLLLSCAATMILFPHFDSKGWMFIFITLLGGAAALLVLSVLSNIFAIYRFETLNKIITLVVWGIIIYILLWYFPLTSYKAPIYQLRDGRKPTKADIQQGLRQLTFNFDFVRRNVRRDENFSHQDLQRNKKITPKQNTEPKEQNEIQLVTDDEE